MMSLRDRLGVFRHYIAGFRPEFLVILGVLAAVLVVQLAYPRGKALPFSAIADESVAFASKEAVSKKLNEQYADVSLRLELPQSTVKTTYAKSGFVLDTARAWREVSAYAWWQRLIPFSLFLKGATTDADVHMKVDELRYKEFVRTTFVTCVQQPVNAGVRVQDGSVVLASAKNGYRCDSGKLQQLLVSEQVHRKGVTMKVPLRTVAPARSDKDVQPLLTTAKQTLARELVLQAGDITKKVPKSELAGWLQFDEKPDGQLVLALNAEKIASYVSGAHANVKVAPKPTVVTTLDGVETGRTPGAPGTGIDIPKTTANIQDVWLKNGTKAATAKVVTQAIAPPTQYSRSYSATQAGLQALLADIAKDKGDYAISLRRSNGETAQINGTKQYHPASTYKMYVAWSVLKRIEAGQMKWDDPSENGKTVAQCFDAMIINSDNPCGEWFGVKIGWSNLNNQLKSVGLSCTNLSSAWLSCAQDETLFLSKIESGQILNGASRDRLLDVMKRQVYRSGIPAGVGVTVADKVGFIDGYLHDAAIVYGAGGTYELTIMTKGSSWSQIADAARQINAQLQRM